MPAPQLTFDVNNHIVGASYDASGNLLADAAGHTYTYNAQHRIATADNNAIRYVYNAFGQRVEKSVGGVAKYYLYDPAGQAVTVLDQNGNWLRGEIFAGGRHIATYVNNTTDFDYSDWLGTERLTATLSGTEQDACTSLPYGDNFSCSGPGSDPSPLHFTGQQHDNETGLDHFPGRNYTSTWATFTSPDPAPWKLADPQTLGRYVYTADNPVTLTDPTGLTPCAGKSGAPCKVKNVVDEKHPGSPGRDRRGHPVHEAAVVNRTAPPDSNGDSSDVKVIYADAQDTGGKGEVGGEAGVGVVDATVSTGAGGPVRGRVNVQSFTADANGHIGAGGLGAGADARVVEWGGQVSFNVGSYTVTLNGTVSAIGAGVSGHVDWSHGFSAGAGAILLLYGASLNVGVTGGH